MSLRLIRVVGFAAILLASVTGNASAQRRSPVGVWLADFSGSTSIMTVGESIGVISSGFGLPANACLSQPASVGAGHGTWEFRPNNRRIRLATMHQVGGGFLRVRMEGEVQPGANGPVVNGTASLDFFPSAQALVQNAPSCMAASSFMLVQLETFPPA